MRKTPNWVDHIIALRDGLPAQTNQGSEINGQRIGYLAQKLGKVQRVPGGRYSFGVERDAYAVCLRPLRIALRGRAPSPQYSAIKGFKIFCECVQKPRRFLLVHKSKSHRGSCGMIEEEARAVLMFPMRLAN